MNVSHHLNELIARYPALEVCRDDLWKAYEILHDVYRQGGMTLVCGNGGSAADSEHIVGELMKEFEIRRPLPQEEQEKLKSFSAEYGAVVAEHLQGALPAISLTGGISLSTAFANDAVPELVFAQQAYGYANPQSALIGISTSGNSKNVIFALLAARLKGARTIGLTGETGGKMKEFCDVCICVPSTCTPDIQELHLPVYHALCKMVEEAFFG